MRQLPKLPPAAERLISLLLLGVLAATGWLALERRINSLTAARLNAALTPLSDELSHLTTTMVGFEADLLALRQHSAAVVSLSNHRPRPQKQPLPKQPRHRHQATRPHRTRQPRRLSDPSSISTPPACLN